jgi:SAM-dependent methyltransferase
MSLFKKLKGAVLVLTVIHQVCFAQGFQDPNRVKLLTEGLQLQGVGLEIAPFYRPTLLKGHYNIYYTDYTTAEELIKKHASLSIAEQIKEHTVAVDFIWHPGRALSDCVSNVKFDYAIASHVIEHVPNVIGWLTQIFSVLKTGGILSLAVPDKRYTFDAYRSETQVHELIDLWLRNQSTPSPAQIFDMLSHACDVPSNSLKPAEEGIPFETLNRNYSDQQALEFAMWAYKTGEYLDIHCSVFTAERFRKIFLKLCELGILNISISEPISCDGEFFIQMVKLGEPRINWVNR